MKKFPKYLPVLLLLLAGASCRTAPAFNFGAYSEAERLYEKKEYEKAIVKYEEYLRENPEGNMAVISHYYMAKSYEALGNKDKARDLYIQIAQEHPDLIWADFSKTRLRELRTESQAPPPANA